jgi:hypothetical protein
MEPDPNGREAEEALVRHADEVRSRLYRAIMALEGRRQHVMTASSRIRGSIELVGFAGLALLTVTAGGVLVYRAIWGRPRPWRERWLLAERAWRRPQDLRAREGMLPKVLKSVVAGVATLLARRLLAKLLERVEEAPAPPHHAALSARATT